MNKHRTQSGFVSIFSVLVIMSVLTLVAVGFSNVTRNAQRRTLDNQLNTQAFYSAESGVNDAKAALIGNPSLNKNECQGPAPGFSYVIDSTLDVGYTCVLINSTLPDLQFDSVPVEGSASPKVVAFESSNGANITSFDVNWDGTSVPMSIPNTTALVPADPNWGANLGVLRLDLAPTNGALDRNTLTLGSYTFFLYPTQASATSTYTVNPGTANQGVVLPIKCASGTSPCVAHITLSPGSSNKYQIRLQAIYHDVKAKIENVKSGVVALSLQNGQSVVDVTGRSGDIFRRIQVRLPATQTGMLPGLAIQSGDSICKRLLASPFGAGTTIDTTGTSTSDDPAASVVCSPSN